MTVYGDGKQSRCFLHVKDAVQGIVAAMELPEAAGEVFNIGSREEVTIEELARQVAALTQTSSKLVYIPYNKAYESGFEDMARRVPDTSKAKRFFGFAPTTNLDGILRNVIEHTKQKELSPIAK